MTTRTITDHALERYGRTLARINQRRDDGRMSEQFDAGYRAGFTAGQRARQQPPAAGGFHLDGCTLDPQHRGACILDRPFRIRPEGGREYVGEGQ